MDPGQPKLPADISAVVAVVASIWVTGNLSTAGELAEVSEVSIQRSRCNQDWLRRLN
jgi:hypothetical protein